MFQDKKMFLGLLLLNFLIFSCTTEDQIKRQVKNIIKEDPSILVEAIEKNPVAIMEALQQAARSAQTEMAKKQKDNEDKQLEESYANPLTPEIRKDESIRGDKKSPLVLVMYSDFECPFCSRGFETVKALQEKYKGKLQYLYKHLPLSFHSNALIAAKYYEAIRLQNEEKAWKFHDDVYSNQGKLKNGEAFLKGVAKDLKVDMAKLAKDINSDQVTKRIEEDQKEAAKFGFQGTPGFVFNGIPVKGAYPIDYFDSIVQELKKRNKVTL